MNVLCRVGHWIRPVKSRLRHLAITTPVPTVDGRPASGVPASTTSSACRPRFTARIRGVSTIAEKQLAARCHDTLQAQHGSWTPRRRWQRLQPCGPAFRWCMWRTAWAPPSVGRMVGLTWTCGGRLVRAVARTRMPGPSSGQFPRPPPAIQQFLEGSMTRWLGSHLSGCRPCCCCTAVQSE